MKNLSMLAAGMVIVGASGFGAIIDTGSAAWQCVSGPTACTAAPTPAVLTTAAPWAAPVGGAQWIGPTATSSTTTTNASLWPLPGQYVYELAFSSLSGGPFTTYSNFRFATDNGGLVQFCDGSNTCSTIHTEPGPYGFSSVANIGSGSIPGAATKIRVTVTNDPLAGAPELRSPSGFFLDGDVSGVPEPSTWAMFGIGSIALLASRFRRRS